MPNEVPGVPMTVENVLPLPRCCPVSGNPQTGSRLTLRYQPKDLVLEVYALRRYVDSYVGGRAQIRSMEAMVQQIAADASAVLKVPVEVVAELVLEPHQNMIVRAQAAGKTEQPVDLQESDGGTGQRPLRD